MTEEGGEVPSVVITNKSTYEKPQLTKHDELTQVTFSSHIGTDSTSSEDPIAQKLRDSRSGKLQQDQRDKWDQRGKEGFAGGENANGSQRQTARRDKRINQ